MAGQLYPKIETNTAIKNHRQVINVTSYRDGLLFQADRHGLIKKIAGNIGRPGSAQEKKQYR